MLTWRIWISCPQLPPASLSRARLTRPITSRWNSPVLRFYTVNRSRGAKVILSYKLCGDTLRSSVSKLLFVLKTKLNIINVLSLWLRQQFGINSLLRLNLMKLCIPIVTNLKPYLFEISFTTIPFFTVQRYNEFLKRLNKTAT